MVISEDLSRPGIRKIVIAGRLTSVSVREFRDFMDEHSSDGRNCLIDMSGVDYVDSTGLGALVYAQQVVSDSGGRLAFAGMQTQSKILFMITNAQKLFEIYPSLDEALAALRTVKK